MLTVLLGHFFVRVEKMFLHTFDGIEGLGTDAALDGVGPIVHTGQVLLQVALGPEALAALVTAERLLLLEFDGPVNPLLMQLKAGVSVDGLAADSTPVGRYSQMPPHVLHEHAHVLEVLFAHAALELGELVAGLSLVYVLEHFAFLLEKDVVERTRNLAQVD